MAIDRVKNTDRIIITGPVLVGFGVLFDRSYGDPKTPRPYPKVIPSRVGDVLLPFACPHCEAVRSQVVDVKKCHGWHDKDRGFSWCPACGGRYVIDGNGTELKEELSVGADAAPAIVERKGERKVLRPRNEGLDVFGTT